LIRNIYFYNQINLNIFISVKFYNLLNMNIPCFIFIIFQYSLCLIYTNILKSKSFSTAEYKINLKSYKDEQLYAEVKIANMTRKVIFDTGSNFLWVQGRGNHTQMLNCGNNCKEEIRKMHINKNIFFIRYGTGSVAITRTKGKLEIFSDQENIKNLNLN
jgi:hypothetical protein